MANALDTTVQVRSFIKQFMNACDRMFLIAWAPEVFKSRIWTILPQILERNGCLEKKWGGGGCLML